MKTYLMLLFVLPFFTVAQELQDPLFQSHIKALAVGDTVPEIVIPAISTGGDPHPGKLSAYKDRLLILDFWTSGCVSCIEGMPNLDSLQRLFPSELSVLLSTFEKEGFIRKFRASNPVMKKLTLPSAVNDQILGAYFPHVIIPHTVWIYKGVVKAITGSEYVTALNIQQVISGKKVDWPIKQEQLAYDYNQPLLKVRTNTGFSDNPVKYSALLGYQDGILPRTGIYRDSVNHNCRGYFINLPVINAYFFLAMKLTDFFKLQRPTLFLTPNQVIVEGDDPKNYWYEPDSSGYLAAWQRLHNICMEVTVPDPDGSLTDRAIYECMQQELDHLLGIHAGFERRTVEVWILRKISGEKKNISPLLNAKTDAAKLVYQLNLQRKNPLVFDESIYEGKMDIKIDDWTNPGRLNLYLKRYGLTLVKERRPSDIFVIRKH